MQLTLTRFSRLNAYRSTLSASQFFTRHVVPWRRGMAGILMRMSALGYIGLACLIIGCGGAGGGSAISDKKTGGGTGKTTDSTGSTTTTGTTTGTTGTTTTTGTTGSTSGIPDLGPNADLHAKQIFPSNDAWNTPVDTASVDPNSANLISSIGLTTGLHPDFGANWNGGPFGIPYEVVSGTQALVPMAFDYSDESDPGPYPFPADAPIEGGSGSAGDRHVIIIDRDHWMLYETWDSFYANPGWHCGSGAIFNLTTDTVRPAGWTSADAAGLPIFPGLARYDEVVGQGAINHALRFTVAHTREAYVAPANHWASSNTSTNLPPMGMRVRLKASFDISTFPPEAQVILRALKKYGMIVADNGSNWYISGAPDARWDDNQLNALKTVQGSNFEVVQMGMVVHP